MLDKHRERRGKKEQCRFYQLDDSYLSRGYSQWRNKLPQLAVWYHRHLRWSQWWN